MVGPPRRWAFMNANVFLFLIVATTLETLAMPSSDRNGQTALLARGGLFLAGGLLLFGYGLSLNLAPVEFERVVGLYIATLFIVWQIVNFVVSARSPSATGVPWWRLIVAGGLIVMK